MSPRHAPPLSPELILRLQRSVGNRAVQRVLSDVAGAAPPADPAALVPVPPEGGEATALATVEVVGVVPVQPTRRWWLVVVSLVAWIAGRAGVSLRLKGKPEAD